VAKKQALTITMPVSGVRETLAAFRGLPKEASKQLREAAGEIADEIADDVRAAGRAEGAQAALVATTVRRGYDRVPVVTAGGTKRLGSRKKPAWKLLFGSEFGSDQYTQFPRSHQGRDGIWIFPSIEENSAMIAKRWQEAAEATIRAFTQGEGVA
jgi:hypothetical protein